MSDTLIIAEVLIPQREVLNIGKVLHQEINENGKFIGSHDENHLLNTLV